MSQIFECGICKKQFREPENKPNLSVLIYSYAYAPENPEPTPIDGLDLCKDCADKFFTAYTSFKEAD